MLLDLLEERVHAFRMEVEGSREGGRSRPRRVTPEELQDDPSRETSHHEGSPSPGKTSRTSNPTLRYQSSVAATSVVLRMAVHRPPSMGLEPTPLGCNSRSGFDLSRILITRRRSSGYIVRKSMIQHPTDSHGGCRNHSGR